MKNRRNITLLVKINLIGFFIAIVALICSFFVKREICQSILISFSINLITSLLVLDFVDVLLDSQSKKIRESELKEIERQTILNYHQIMELLISIYILEFNQLTIPIDKRTKDNRFLPIDENSFNSSYKLNDLCDFASTDIFPFAVLGDNIISAYNNAFEKLEVKFETMLTIADFRFYPQIRKVIEQFIRTSMLPNGIDTLKMFSKCNNTKELSIVTQMIQKYDGDPINDYKEQTYSGNIFLHVINLFVHLERTKQIIEQYRQEIEKIMKTN